MSVREVNAARRRVVASHKKVSPDEAAAKRAAREAQRHLKSRGIGARVEVERRARCWWALVAVPVDVLGSLVGLRER